MSKTKIPWSEHSWDVYTGCLHNCKNNQGEPYCFVQRFIKGNPPRYNWYLLKEPINRKKPTLYFVASKGDLFGDWVRPDLIEATLGVVKKCPRHTFQFLTKNPARMLNIKFPDNCWVGASVTRQREKFKIDIIKNVSARIKFISIEPILEKIKYNNWNGINQVLIGAETSKNSYTPVDEKYSKECAEPLIKNLKKIDIKIFIKENLKWPEKIQEYPESKKQEELWK